MKKLWIVKSINTIQIREKLFANVLPESIPKYLSSFSWSLMSSSLTILSNPGIFLNGIKLKDQVVTLRPDK